jgi:hypothetical protein
LLTWNFTALDAKEAALTIEHKGAGIEPITRSAMKSSDDLWRIDRLLIPTSGKWNVTLNVLVTDFDKLSACGNDRCGPLTPVLQLHFAQLNEDRTCDAC